MFHLIFSIPSWYVIARFVFPLAMPLVLKIILSLVVLLASQYLLISRFTPGGIFSPEMPRAITILFNWAFGTVLLLAFTQLLIDAVAVFSLLIRHPWPINPGVRYAAAQIGRAARWAGV